MPKAIFKPDAFKPVCDWLASLRSLSRYLIGWERPLISISFECHLRLFLRKSFHNHCEPQMIKLNNCSTLVNVGTRRGTIDKTEVGFDRGAPKSVFRIGRFRAENVEIEIVTSDINKPYVIITITNRKLTTNTPFLYNQQY